MSRLLIKGGVPLSGSVKIGGAKNSALPLMAAVLLSKTPVTLQNVPKLDDVETMGRVLESVGVKRTETAPGEILFDSTGNISEEPPYELVKTMRASFFVMGPLLGRLGRARVPLPGGCAIGVRPVNIHLKGFEALGAKVSIEGGCAVAVADKLIGTKIMLDFPSVGATENLMMAASLAEGTTVIENAAREPEIDDLASFLNSMGAKITGTGTQAITIEGVSELKGSTYQVIPDRIDAGTFMVLGAISKGQITIENCEPNHLQSLISKLREMGAVISIEDRKITVQDPGQLKGVEVKTLPYPGFPTDMQAQFMVAMAVAEGNSFVTETVFENRFMHVSELIRMGGSMNIHERTVAISGVKRLTGAPVSATDLRAGAAMALAGLIAEGETVISNVFHINRGYENLVGRLSGLGACISEIPDDER